MWDNLEKTGGNSREIDRVKFEFDKPVKVRLIGDVLTRYVYWISTNNGGKRLPIECLRFDRKTQMFVDTNKDPVTEIDSALYDSSKPSFAYVAQCIDRADNKLKLFDLKQTIFNSIVDYAKNPEYGNPADPEKGYDITILKQRTGPATINVGYTVTPSRAVVPLTKEEKEMELFDLNQIMKRPSADEVYAWLVKNTSLVQVEGDTGEFGGPTPDEFQEKEKHQDLA